VSSTTCFAIVLPIEPLPLLMLPMLLLKLLSPLLPLIKLLSPLTMLFVTGRIFESAVSGALPVSEAWLVSGVFIDGALIFDDTLLLVLAGSSLCLMVSLFLLFLVST